MGLLKLNRFVPIQLYQNPVPRQSKRVKNKECIHGDVSHVTMASCVDCLSWTIVVVFFYVVVRKIINVLRIDRYTDVYVLITGCDTGFGNEAAKRFDRMGCHVFAGCLTEKGKESLKEACSDRLHAISLDVSKPESVREAYEYVKANLPKGRGLWGVINNAGVFGKLGALEWYKLGDYREVFDINLYGIIDVTMTFLPLVKKAQGRIVNTSSTAGRFTLPVVVPYCITKYGIEAFTDGLRRSLRPYGVKAILVEPGGHKTHLTSSQNMSNLVNAAWNSASPEIKEEFGESYLKETMRGMDLLTEKFGSDKITDVVDAYEMGLLGRYPRARYPVGWDSHAFFLLQALPEWLGDRIFGVIDKPPIPACLK